MGLCVADICDMRGSDWLLNMVPKNLGRNNPSVLNILNTTASVPSAVRLRLPCHHAAPLASQTAPLLLIYFITSFNFFESISTLCTLNFDRERYDLLASPNGSSMLYKAEIVYALASVELFTILSQRDSCFCLYSVCRLPRYLAIALQESDPST